MPLFHSSISNTVWQPRYIALYFFYIYVSFCSCSSAAITASSSPFTLRDLSSDDNGLCKMPISPGPNSAKRTLSREDNMISKRVRVSDQSLEYAPPRPPSSMLPQPTASSPPRSQNPQRSTASSSLSLITPQRLPSSALPRPTVGLPARVDKASHRQGNERFIREIQAPILQGLSILLGKCTSCFIIGDEDWEDHYHDHCQGRDMHYGYDGQFVAFKRSFNFQKHFCYGCGLNKVRIILST